MVSTLFCQDIANASTLSLDCSDYDTSTWVERDGATLKEIGRRSFGMKTKADVEACEAEYGVRYSELFRLSYYDPVRMHVVDPMHNLLLVISKHVYATWVEQAILDDRNRPQDA